MRYSATKNIENQLAYVNNGTVNFELLVYGMTFDMSWLALDEEDELLDFAHHFNRSSRVSFGPVDCLALQTGPHLAGAENAMPVFKIMVRLAKDLAGRLGEVVTIGWPPARSLMSGAYFIKIAESWLAGGPFPALGLTSFSDSDDSGLKSEGLAFFTGQELLLDRELCRDKAFGTRLGVRLIDELVGRAPLSEEVSFIGPDGASLRLTPIQDERIIRVSAD